tara:strand:- start:931 stop:1140 length:210 start_codon:yes stop_codon:yes gene_type:complete
MIELNYKEVLENNSFTYINVLDTCGYVIERFTCKTEMAAYLVKKALLPLEWSCYLKEHTSETIINVFVL